MFITMHLDYIHIVKLIFILLDQKYNLFFVNSYLLDSKFLCVVISVYLLPYVFSLQLRYLFTVILISEDKWYLSWPMWCSKMWSVSPNKLWWNCFTTVDSIYRWFFFMCDPWFTSNDRSLENNLSSFSYLQYCWWWKSQTPPLQGPSLTINKRACFSSTGCWSLSSSNNCFIFFIHLFHLCKFAAKLWPCLLII